MVFLTKEEPQKNRRKLISDANPLQRSRAECLPAEKGAKLFEL